MNQHRYRLVYNRARRMLMAVAETAVSLGTTPGSRDVPASPPAHRFQLRGLALALWLAWLPQTVHAQLVPDAAAPGNQRATLLNAGNGVPLANIQTPSAGGVRTTIPKGDGRYRPLGIPSFEDRLVQDRLSRILQAIWEPEFRECSFGFRPGRGAHGALRRVAEVITNEGTQWVVEADIKGFFDHVSHAHLERFLAHRISDGNLLRIIRRFLKAGILEDGAFTASEEGTPQGGLVSPVLSNIYLHYVLDLWFEKRFARSCEGRAHLIRYADDYVACFQQEADARRFLTEMTERLAPIDLENTRAGSGTEQDGDPAIRTPSHGPRTFSFLGFTHYVGRSRTEPIKGPGSHFI